MDLEERWDEVAWEFIPDFEEVYKEEGMTYPFFGTGDGGVAPELNDEQEVFDWLVAPIKNDPEMWRDELNSIEERNIITPEAIRLIETRADCVLPF